MAPWEIDRQIGQRILSLMPRDSTQAALAKDAEIPESTLSRYLHPSGSAKRYRGTPASALLAIARALHVTICDLYGVDEPHANPAGADLTPAERQALDNIARELVNLRGAQRERFSSGRHREFARDSVGDWSSMDEEERQFYRDLAAEVRRLDEQQP